MKRLDPRGGRMLATVASDLHESQALAVDAAGDISLSEQTATRIIELRRD